MQNDVYVPLKLDQQKIERVRKLYRSERPEQALEQVFDDMLYMDKMRRLMMKYKGKIHIKSTIAPLDNLWNLARMSKKLIVPLWSECVEAGRLLSKLQSQKGYEIKKTLGLTNDVLIALSARRLGATVITQNRKDFEAIQSVKDFKLKIVS